MAWCHVLFCKGVGPCLEENMDDFRAVFEDFGLECNNERAESAFQDVMDASC